MAPHSPSRLLSLAACAILIAGSGFSAARADEAPKSPEAPEVSNPPELTESDINQLIDDLSHDDFTTRESAQKKLGEITITSGLAETVRQRFAKTDNPEVKLRLRRVLYQVAKAEFLGRPKAFLGIQMQDSVVIGGKTGREMLLSVMVLSVIPGSAAEEHGIEPGDHILTVDGKGFGDAGEPSMDFKSMVGARAAGDEVKFHLRRRGILLDKKVVLGEMPADLMLANSQTQAAFEPYFQHWLEHGGTIQRP